MKKEYEYKHYKIYPDTGQIFNTKTNREISAKSKRVVLDTGKKHREVRTKIYFIYELVNGPLKVGAIVRPKNGDYTDARIDNIELVSRKEYFDGHDWSMKVVLSKTDCDEIKKLHDSHNIPCMDLALTYNVSKSTIQKVLNGEYYYDVKEN